MVCRECGAYNAEHLSHCRVCAARLKDTEAELSAEESMEGQDAGRPQRDFVRAPSWPTRPYAGAPDKATYTPSAKTLPDVVEDDGEYEDDITELPEPEHPLVRRSPAPPVAERRTSAARPSVERRSEPVEVHAASPAIEKQPISVPKSTEVARVCTACGKTMLPDAPYCAYCGVYVGLPGEARKAAVQKQERTVAAAPIAAKAKRGRLQEEEFDLEDEEEIVKKPSKATKKAKKPAYDEDEFEDDADEEEYDDADEDEFDDDDEKSTKGGRGTTILFWALIVLLVALIGVFGMYIVKKNYGGDINNLIASVMGNKAPDVTDADVPAANVGIGSGTVDAAKLGTGTITETVDAATGTELYEICVYAPTGSTLKINTVTELQNGGVTTIPNNDQMIVRIPRAAFLPNEPQDADTIVITPDIVATTPDGQVMQISIPPVELSIASLTLIVNEPVGMMTTATSKNEPITISGTVDDHTVSVYVAGQQCTVYEGGAFSATYQPTDNQTQQTVLVEAKKNNCKTATATVTIDPYVVQNMSLVVTNDAAGLEAKDGGLTLTGTVTPGATITAASASSSVTCGTAAVTESGAFSLSVTVNAVGAFDVTLTATQEGYHEATTVASVYRLPTASSSAFKKASAPLNSAAFTKMADGTTTGGDFTFTGTITEIVGTTPYTVVKIQLSTGEELYMCNRSAKNKLESDDVKKKKEIAGTYVGTYLDTGVPYVWAWYIWNK